MTTTRLEPDSAAHRLVDVGSDVWVSASAGTGKTHALTVRLAAALLAGVDPRSIVAITYTRTAAAEIADRVSRLAAEWALADEAGLEAALRGLGLDASPELCSRARGLAVALADVPEGLAIGTIHGFAQSLVSAFPLEAGLAPGLRVLDDRETQALAKQAFAAALESADGDPAFAADLHLLARERAPARLEQEVTAMLAAVPTLLALGPGGERVEAALGRLVGLPTAASREDVLRARLDTLDLEVARRLAQALPRAGTPPPVERFERWLALDSRARLDALADLLCLAHTTTGEARRLERAVAKGGLDPGRVRGLVAACDELRELDRAFRWRAVTGARLRLAARLASRYVAAKRDAGAIDYADMIGHAAQLMASEHGLSWVAWRLDRQFRHLLLDEGQDTSPEAWEIVDRLGPDRRGDPLALGSRFTVGDFKQAIYGFQGSDPGLFARRHRAFREPSPRPGHDVALQRNYRSAPVVLRVVDEVLAEAGPQALGLDPDQPVPPHVAHRRDAAGSVRLLPLVVVERDEDEGDDDEVTPAETELARRLAALARSWLMPGEARLAVGDGKKRRWARPGDLLFLVRARGEIMAALVAALHGAGVEVAGADRLRLMAPLALRDVVALMRFVVQPADDLALATLLVSPIFGWSHEEVRRLRVDDPADAVPAPQGGLWQRLRERGGDEAAWLAARLARADIDGPHAFLHAALADPRGRRAIRARMGVEPEEALDALLDEARRFEAARAPSLVGFLAWLDSGGEEVKRDAEGAGDRARILTVHASKGLQAPIVVLADAARAPTPPHEVALELVPGLPRVGIPCAGAVPRAIDALRDEEVRRQAAEDQRLLYVAMTRAADHLIIADHKRAGPAAGRSGGSCWHDQLRAALLRLGAQSTATPGFDGETLLLETLGPAPPPAPEAARPPPPFAPPPPPPAEEPRRLAVAATPTPPLGSHARRRGLAVHRLVERLATGRLGLDEARAARFLAGEGLGDAAPALAARVVAMARHPLWAELFSGRALAEVPFAVALEGRQLAGTFDLLLLDRNRALVVDLKTSAHVPGSAEAVPATVLDQMARYAQAAAQLFAGRRIELGLLYLAGPKMLSLDPAVLLARPLAAEPAET